MGTVIQFKRPLDDDVDRQRKPAGDGGEVVIFPGVRVEYHAVDLSHRVMALPAHDADPICK